MARLDLTPHACEGYDAPAGAACPYYATSPASEAWLLGAFLRATGRARPRDVRPGRGARVNVQDMRFRRLDNDGRQWERER